MPSADLAGEVPVTLPPAAAVGGDVAGDAPPDETSPVVVAMPAAEAAGCGGGDGNDALSVEAAGGSPADGASVETPRARTEGGAAPLTAADLAVAAGAAAGAVGAGMDLSADGGDGEVIFFLSRL